MIRLSDMKKSELFKTELTALMNKYGYKFIDTSDLSDTYYPPIIGINDDGADPLDMLEVWDKSSSDNSIDNDLINKP